MTATFLQAVKHALRRQRPRVSRLRLRLTLLRLLGKNLLSSMPVTTATGAAVVSLTTYGERANTVFLAVESIASGTVLPARIILWIDDELLRNLPQSLLRLQRRGLEIRSCENFGPHTKYYPYVESESAFTTPLVTADDDVMYPADWLNGLIQAHARHPDVVNCYSSRRVIVNDRGLAPYLSWPLCSQHDVSFAQMAMGVSGVIYPPELQRRLKVAGRHFVEACPKADDVWLHRVSIHAGFRISQISDPAGSFDIIPGTQARALYLSNQLRGENDKQIQRTYTAADVELLRRASVEGAATGEAT